MPTFNLSEAEINSLSDYMLSAYQAARLGEDRILLSPHDDPTIRADSCNEGASPRTIQTVCLHSITDSSCVTYGGRQPASKVRATQAYW